MFGHERLRRNLGFDEFRFLRDGAAALNGDDGTLTKQALRGAIHTPSGDRIPALVVLHPARYANGYSHVGEVRIPDVWVDEFQDAMARFFFWSEEGECFSQLQVLEDVATDEEAPVLKGRILLLRDRPRDDDAASPTRH